MYISISGEENIYSIALSRKHTFSIIRPPKQEQQDGLAHFSQLWDGVIKRIHQEICIKPQKIENSE